MNQYLKLIVLVFVLGFSNAAAGQSLDFLEIVKKVVPRDNLSVQQREINDSLELAKRRYVKAIYSPDMATINILEKEYAKLVQLEGYEINEAKYLCHKGYKHHVREEIDSALYYYKKSLHHIPESYPGTHVHKFKIIALCSMASIYHHNLYDPAQALIYIEDALHRCDKYFYPGYRLEAKSLVASIYSYAGDYKEAIQIAEQALDFNKFNEAWDYGGEDYLNYIILAELQRLYTQCEDCGREKDAFDLLQSILEYYEKKNRYSQMTVLASMAAFQSEFLLPEQSTEYMNRALQYAKTKGLPPSIRRVKLNHAIYLVNNGQIDKSIFILDSLKNNVDTSNLLFHKDVNTALYQAYLKHGNQEKAKITKARSNHFSTKIKRIYNSENVLRSLEMHKVNDSQHLVNQLERRSEIIYLLAAFVAALLCLSIILLGITYYSRRKIGKQNVELQLANKAKNELFLILSHDLKGPISSFDNLSKRVSYLLHKKDYEGLKKFSEYFSKSGESLKQTVNSLLDWSLSQKDNFILSPENINIYQSINHILEELDYLIIDKKIVVELNIKNDHEVSCDKNSFLIIYRNLIANAIKNSNVGGKVKIYTERKNDLNIYIENVTVDMTTDKINKLRAAIDVPSEGVSLQMRTSGIGLHTVSNLIRHNDGKIFLKVTGNIISVKTYLPRSI